MSWKRKTSTSLLCAIALTISSCSTAPPPEPLDVFSGLRGAEAPEIVPLEVPKRPRAEIVEQGGKQYLGFPADRRLETYLRALEANSAALGDAILVIEAQEREREALLRAGEGVEREANFYARLYRETEAELASERLWNAIKEGVMAAVALIAVALAL